MTMTAFRLEAFPESGRIYSRVRLPGRPPEVGFAIEQDRLRATMFSARTLACKRLGHTFIRPATRLSQTPINSRIAGMATISDAIKKDHHELEKYFNEVVNSTDADHQQRYGNQFTWELARHSIGEELLVYPAYESNLGAEGVEMAETDRKDHHRVRNLSP